MASISVPSCPEAAMPSGIVGSKSKAQTQRVSFTAASFSNPSLSFASSLSGFQWTKNNMKSAVAKVQVQLNEKISNSAPVLDSVPSEPEEESAGTNIPDASLISAFVSQVSDLVKLVDSKDISELQMKQLDCELVIRKKEALQQPAAPLVTMQHSYPQTMLPPPPPASPAPAAAPTPASAAPAPASTLPPKTSMLSHPPLKCPMAGTFYRSPGPGEPPFVKVGDKVQKGQVVCIVEAMKLMNEIEADQAGTIAEILVEDGKPVSVDTPLFVIVP